MSKRTVQRTRSRLSAAHKSVQYWRLINDFANTLDYANRPSPFGLRVYDFDNVFLRRGYKVRWGDQPTRLETNKEYVHRVLKTLKRHELQWGGV